MPIQTRLKSDESLRLGLISLLACLLISLPAIADQALENRQQPAEQHKAAQPPENETKKTPSVIDQFKELPAQTQAPIRTEKIDQAGEEIGHRISLLGWKLSPQLGRWLDSEFLWGLNRLQIGLSLALLLCVLLFERLVRALLRRQLSRQRDKNRAINWQTILISGIGRPLSLFIWVYGVYGALSPLIAQFSQPGLPRLIQTLLRRATDIGGTIAALWLLYRLLHLVDFQLSKWGQELPNTVGLLIRSLSQRLRHPLKMLVLLVFVRILTPLLNLTQPIQTLVGQLFGLLFIGAIAWLIIQILNSVELAVLHRHKMDAADNLTARKMHTQVRFLKRTAISLVIILAAGSMFMVFERVRQLGTSILASAGIIGIMVGLAAQRSISNILVGLQIALTQPIRLDDVVIVENEWGRIEEITTTYVVVKLWDLRRLIVPTTYFTEKTFQNWTRVSAELLGTVFVYVDYTVPVDAIRGELERIVGQSAHWNGKLAKVEVTGTTAQTMEVRLLVSADNASLAWDLRCEIRERMITFLQTHYPECLPRIRAELRQPAGGTGEAGQGASALAVTQGLALVRNE